MLIAWLAALALALVPAPALARAVVVRAVPADGAVLGAAPRVISLWFDHAVVVEPGAVELTDMEGRAIALLAVAATPYRPEQAQPGGAFDATYLFLCSIGLRSYPSLLIIELPALAPGTYRLDWRVIGLEDRRGSAGALVFAVRPGQAGAGAPGAEPAALGSVAGRADDLLVRLSVAPNLPGENFVRLHVADTRRPAPAPIERVFVRLIPPGGTQRPGVAAEELGGGHYQLAGNSLDRPGVWTVAITVERRGMPDATFVTSWEVTAADPGAAPRFPQPIFALTIPALAGVLIVALARRRRRPEPQTTRP